MSSEKDKKSIKTTSEKQIQKILDGWACRHGQCWDFYADERNVRKALKQLEKLMIKINS